MKNKKVTIYYILIGIIACVAMCFVEIYIKPTYFIKSIYKIICFVIVPFLMLKIKKLDKKSYLIIKNKRQIIYSILMGIGVYAFIFGGYLVVKEVIDLKLIENKLSSTLGVSKNNFVYISIYISVINSFIEEYFFRGILFISLSKYIGKIKSIIISASLFSLYHVAIIASWFNLYMFGLIIIGLFFAGVIFNYIDSKTNNIYNSWLVHMFANFSINTIGFIMFGIIGG